MATAKKTTAKKPDPVEDEEIGWTIRMPRSLADKIKARAAALTAASGGAKWTGNAVAVDALKKAAEGWGEE
jgi:hypothetical protein